jgi:hypothetical protein
MEFPATPVTDHGLVRRRIDDAINGDSAPDRKRDHETGKGRTREDQMRSSVLGRDYAEENWIRECNMI